MERQHGGYTFQRDYRLFQEPPQSPPQEHFDAVHERIERDRRQAIEQINARYDAAQRRIYGDNRRDDRNWPTYRDSYPSSQGQHSQGHYSSSSWWR